MNRGNAHRNRQLVRALGVLSVLVFLGGCSSAKFIPTGSVQSARADDCPVEVFTSKVPDREYVELGVLEGEGSFGADTLEKILPKMKQEACRAGGDAIIMTSSQKYAAAVGEDHDDHKLSVQATVIRWTRLD